jgi:hypothetical protein
MKSRLLHDGGKAALSGEGRPKKLATDLGHL